MLPKYILNETPLYAAVSVPGGDFFLWTHFRKGKWLVGLSDVVRVWQVSYDAQERHRLDEPNTSLQNYLGHFCDSVIHGSTHVREQEDEGTIVLSVWRHDSNGEQVKTEYTLSLVTNTEQRIRMVQHMAVEMARRCAEAKEDDENKVETNKQTNIFKKILFLEVEGDH